MRIPALSARATRTSPRGRGPARRRSMVGLAAASLLVLAGCGNGGSEALDPGAGDGDGGSGGGEVVVGHQNYTEMEIMAEMYAALLEDAGFQPTLQGVDARDLYVGPLTNGSVQVVPEYVSSMTEFLNKDINGADAEPVATPDADETLGTLEELGQQRGITPLEPAEAEDANAFAVTEEFSQQNGVSTLSELGEYGQPIALGAAPDCPDRDDCKLGLESVYGIQIQSFEPLGFGTVQTKDALAKGEIQLGQVGTSDGSLDARGLVVLEDDKNWQNAENLVPVVNSDFLDDNPEVADALNQLSSELSTEDLKELNKQVDEERMVAADVASNYLTEKGLI